MIYLFQCTSYLHSYQADEGICYCGIRMNGSILLFPHSPSLSVPSTSHSAIRLTSALHIFFILPVPTLIPALPQIQHNQCFIWPWLNPPPLFIPPPRKGWEAILCGNHPINLCCQSTDFSAGTAHSLAQRALRWRERASKLNKSRHHICSKSEWARVCFDCLPSHT